MLWLCAKGAFSKGGDKCRPNQLIGTERSRRCWMKGGEEGHGGRRGRAESLAPARIVVMLFVPFCFFFCHIDSVAQFCYSLIFGNMLPWTHWCWFQYILYRYEKCAKWDCSPFSATTLLSSWTPPIYMVLSSHLALFLHLHSLYSSQYMSFCQYFSKATRAIPLKWMTF